MSTSQSHETWRRVPGHERYCVSDEGQVHSHHRSSEGRILRPALNPQTGYRYVVLDGQTVTIHRLVLEAFIGPRSLGIVARHLNGDAMDNRLANLAYGTQRENVADSIKHETFQQTGSRRWANGKCINGHDITDPLNVRVAGSRRRCAACERARVARVRSRAA